MKKLLIVGVVAYGGYKLATKVVKAPAFTLGHSDTSTQNAVANKLMRYISRNLPYGVFCEITGCKFEVHGNSQEGLDRLMQDHLNTDH
jgi:hypothetical protein